jgi:subtilase family serine protease
MRKGKTSLSAAVVAGAVVAAGMAAATSADAAPHRKAVPRTAPSWVSHANSLGTVASGKTTSFRVYLAPNGGTDALKAAVADVSTPGSASYRHFLSAKQYHARFDATRSTVNSVSGFLRDNHLSVTKVEAHHRYLQVRGSAADVQKALGVTLKRFRHHGQVVQANTSAVTLPAEIASYVTTVSGLDTTPSKMTHTSPPPAGFRNARPCSRYYGQVQATYQADFKTRLPKFGNETLPYAPCGYTGPQYRAAYEGAHQGKLSGAGVTVAIIDAFGAPTIAKDAETYGENHGDGGYAPGQLTQVLPGHYEHAGTGTNDCDASGWYGEETLDVEAVHAMAPDAHIRYYGAVSCYDDKLLDTQTQVVDDNIASIVTNSYGEAEEALGSDLAAAEQQVFLQAAMQGISFMFSSGDSGDELANTAIKQADASASDPYVTAVGGTADAIGATGNMMWQTGWGTVKYSLSQNGNSWDPVGYLYGAGGGESALYNKPAYQQGVVPSKFGSGRQVPDVAMDADPNTGMLVGETQTFSDGKHYGEYRIGGTSLASPLFAGMTALASQSAGGRLGFLNPKIYSQAGTPVFNDVKGSPRDAGVVRVDYANSENASGGLLYSVRTFDQDSSLVTVKGWDNVTGVGSPNSSWLTSMVGATAASSSR